MLQTLHNINLYGRDPREKKNDLPHHKTARLNLAKKYEKNPDKYWEHILSSEDKFAELRWGFGEDRRWKIDLDVPKI